MIPRNFDNVANEIISKSINSIMFIDDDLCEPFENGEDKGIELSKGIYDSFRLEDRTVDFYKFSDLVSWKKKSSYTLDGRDLLIIDWQLAKLSPEYLPTISIISEAVKKNSLHFVCIYTATDKKDFPDIFYKINSYFSPFSKQVIKEDAKAIEDLLDQEGYVFSDIFNGEIISYLKEMVLYKENAGKIFSEIKRLITNKTDSEIIKLICQVFLDRVKNGFYPNLLYGFCGLGIYLNKEEICEDNSLEGNDIQNFVSQNFLIVNHTIIIITNKTDIKPENLYAKFRDVIIHNSGNFLTLMGLEMRNLFKESSSFIGKDIDGINELAFFHHKDKSIPSEAFYDFLRELWKSQAASFLYDKNKQPKIFSVLDEYKQSKNINEEMSRFISNPNEYQQHLGKLNYYYNSLVTSRKSNDEIRFGDIFRIYTSEHEKTDQYLLCITAHCDCLYAQDKINNMFYFVKGSKGNLANALKGGDTQFDSYIKNDSVIEVVNWFNKPFTVYVAPEKNNIELNIEVSLGADIKVLIFHSTLKENYAQRIANNAFIYPFHVGIFFADTKGIN